tara:strand:+ start:335 stop:541 length:207 start_codon:yes stop_codon:yes gene_type:complete
LLEKPYGENFIMVRTLIGLKVASSMFAVGVAAGMGIMALCKYTKSGTCGKSETHNSDGLSENSVSETS